MSNTNNYEEKSCQPVNNQHAAKERSRSKKIVTVRRNFLKNKKHTTFMIVG